MGVFQKLANWIKSWSFPQWVNEALETVQELIIVAVTELGKEALWSIKDSITYASEQEWTGEKKIKYVVDTFKRDWSGVMIKDSMLRLVIEILVNVLKSQGMR